jgi:hypothetical protein
MRIATVAADQYSFRQEAVPLPSRDLRLQKFAPEERQAGHIISTQAGTCAARSMIYGAGLVALLVIVMSVFSNALVPAAVADSPPSTAFSQGQADRQTWDAWFSSQTGGFRTGAEYWAAHRSDPKPGSCETIYPGADASWIAGCRAAKQRLVAPDLRRKMEPEYRRGWNYPPPAGAVPSSGAMPTQTLPAIPRSPSVGGVSETGAKISSRDNGSGTTSVIVLTAVAFVVFGAILKLRRKRLDRRRRIERACTYFSEVNERRSFPRVPVSVNLQAGEVGLFEAPARLSEMRAHHYSTGARIRIAKGVWVGGSRSHAYHTRDIVDHGIVAITTRRIAYAGHTKTAQVMFHDLVGIEGDLDCNLVHSSRRQNAIMIHYADALLGLLLVRLFADGSFVDNRLPSGWRLLAQPQGEQVAISLRKETPEALAS